MHDNTHLKRRTKRCAGRSSIALNSLFHLGPVEVQSYSVKKRSHAVPEDP